MKAFIAVSGLLVDACLLSACGMKNIIDAGNAEDLGTLDSSLFVNSKLIWPSKTIPACWEDVDSYATERRWVRDAIEGTWEAASQVEFNGWGRMQQQIQENPDPSPDRRTEQQGRHRAGWEEERDEAKLYLWELEKVVQKNREHCIRVDAIHEFGHALSFSHEQNREDTPDSCDEDQEGSHGDLVFVPWDDESMVN